jgi:hypothetical protein
MYLEGQFLWTEEKWPNSVLLGLSRLFGQMKGRMLVLSGETDWHSLAAGFPKIIRDQGSLPRGTIEREAKAERYGLPFPPEQRTSFLAELLPYLGRGGVYSTLQPQKFAWYAPENLQAAESWIPEFLVPSYDQSAWRANHPLAPQASLGATNYVGLAGIGRDAARYNPNDPSVKTKLGMTGYDWSSKPEQVTDGLSNTIYMIQVPAGLQRPWIAGGGATLTGVDDTGEPFQEFASRAPDGSRGTHVLMGDGSVRFLKEGIAPKTFRALVTRAGGESIDLDKISPKLKPARTGELRGDAGR